MVVGNSLSSGVTFWRSVSQSVMLRMMNIYALIFYLITLVIVITVHEFSHAWMGHMLGDVTAKGEGRLSLNPLVHIDPFLTLLLPVILIISGSPVVFGAAKPVPFNPYAVRYGKWGAAAVAAAGPASNFLMAAFVALWLRVFSSNGLTGQFLLSFVIINLGFFVFNMIPIPPLDGSRVLYAIAPAPLADAMDQLERRGGILVIFLLLMVGYRFIGPVIAQIVGFLATILLGTRPF